MVAVRLEEVTRDFGPVRAVDRVSLDVADGELFFLLGPSGCGKTTILRTVAGFEIPDRGRVFFDGKDVTALAPHRRNTGMVFQNYALWPHMTVAANVAYGLKVRRLGSATIRKRTAEALEMVRMAGEADRYPNQLSGGQQQRVALARALVINPDCLLLDEPLSNLDAQLRLEMRAEIRRIHAETGVTTIYVTHDQKEALSMAQRMAILVDGRIAQVGAPDEVYNAPADVFVAAFVGETNLLEGTVASVQGLGAAVDTDIGRLAGTIVPGAALAAGDECLLSIRPEHVQVSAAPGGQGALAANLVEYTFLGEVGQCVFAVGSGRVRALVVAPSDTMPQGPAWLAFPAVKALVFPGVEATGRGAG